LNPLALAELPAPDEDDPVNNGLQATRGSPGIGSPGDSQAGPVLDTSDPEVEHTSPPNQDSDIVRTKPRFSYSMRSGSFLFRTAI